MSQPGPPPPGVSLIDRFIPSQVLSGDPDLVHRTRLGLAFAWVAAALFLFGVVTQTMAGNTAAAVVDFGCTLALIASSLAVKRTGRIVPVAHVALTLIFVTVIGLAVEVRGPGLSGATLMLMVIPLFATLICGPRHGVVWLGISLTSGLTLGLLGHAGVIANRLSAPIRLFNDHVVLLIFTLVLFAVARVYERRKDQAMQHISELESQRRLAELGQLRAHAATQLAKVEQFASLGRVAAAAAHEINNPLAYVISSIEFARQNRKPEDEAEVLSALSEAAEGAERINRIVRDLAAPLRPANDSVTRVVVKEWVHTAIDLAKPHTRGHARVQTRYAEVPMAMANAPRLTQVLLSLILNACQALPEGRSPEPEIDIEVRPEGACVCIEISHKSEQGPRGVDGGLAVILGAAVVSSFEGNLTFETTGGRTVALLRLQTSIG